MSNTEEKEKPIEMDVDEEESDIEIEGIDQDGDYYVDNGSQDEDDEIPPTFETEEQKEETNKLALEEAKELEAARKERMELLAAEQKKLAEKVANQGAATLEDKFQYLVSQSDVFAHFLAGSVAAAAGKGKGGNRGKKGRLTEAEEDAQMLKSAQSERHTIRVTKQPSILAPTCKMHPYQLEGLNFLVKLHDHGINGILADEMGLGKTLQTISLLAYLRESRGSKGPHLIIVPKSVVGNWIRELKKWCPVIRSVRMLGTKEERKAVCNNFLKPASQGDIKFDVVVTSYEGILREKNSFMKVAWKYLIIDEAHRIKNANSSLSQVVRMMKTEFRLLITGTPLQNNLNELWALLNFILPDIFGDSEQFDQWFNVSGEAGQDNVIRKLHTVLRPFMIRRVKKDVACALPPKKETKLYVGLTPMQQEWYKRLLRKDAFELNALGGPEKTRLLNILMQLRKVCNHPYLFDGAEEGPPYSDGPHLWENSGKMSLLHKLLPKLKANGSRVLIFSQMTRVLDILQDYLTLVGHKFCRIDGNTDGEDRDARMDAFNAPGSDIFAFLLSTRAGGLGINLATADIVILFDSDWNPQVDLQAMDRAHRIGQTKPVQVFRFISEGTVEEKIIERADRKLFLDAAVIQQGRLAEEHGKLSKDDLMKMVKFGADQILSGNGGTYTDEDIDALIAKGEEKTSAIQAKLKTNAQHDLTSFSLLAEEENNNLFQFGGKDYRDNNANTGSFITLPQRERKRNYNVDEYFRDNMQPVSTTNPQAKKRRKGHNFHDFQLFDKHRLGAFSVRERELEERKSEQMKKIEKLRTKAKTAPSVNNARVALRPGESREEIEFEADELEKGLSSFELTAEEQEEKRKLLDEGFSTWTKRDFRIFCTR
jgi:SWI/SNF-related matrix-associated actin-dependent regulator of chromatin subfamily A member 5